MFSGGNWGWNSLPRTPGRPLPRPTAPLRFVLIMMEMRKLLTSHNVTASIRDSACIVYLGNIVWDVLGRAFPHLDRCQPCFFSIAWVRVGSRDLVQHFKGACVSSRSRE